MKLIKNFIFYIIFFTIGCPIILNGQDQKLMVEIGETSIVLNKPFIVSIILKNEEERPNCKFPEIPGFKKRGIVSSSFTNTTGGKTIENQKVSQEYYANKAGVINLSSFNIQVNDQFVSTGSINVTVFPTLEDEPEQNFKDFIDGSAYEFVDVKDDAFFAITTSKLKPYVGEGFLLTAAFYIAQSNKAEMAFFNENVQLDMILKQIRPKNCWEENANISEIKINKLIKIDKKSYNQYKIFQANYYPLNNQTIVIPTVSWQMVKYKIAKDREVSNKKEESRKTYMSKPMVIRPQNLPQNSKNISDFVGDFQLQEKISNDKIQTGKSFKYQFIIKGIGNMDVIRFAQVASDSLFEIYEPTVSQSSSVSFGKLIKEKSFSFDIVPKFAGKFSLKDRFFISYFNVVSKSYEELRAKSEIEVVGKAINDAPEPIALNDDLYAGIEKLKSGETDFDYRGLLNFGSNIMVILMLISMIYIVWPFNKK